jgi:hypothetical protein
MNISKRSSSHDWHSCGFRWTIVKQKSQQLFIAGDLWVICDRLHRWTALGRQLAEIERGVGEAIPRCRRSSVKSPGNSGSRWESESQDTSSSRLQWETIAVRLDIADLD